MTSDKKTKYYSLAEALEKARRYCAYQERCQSEVRSKLLEWGQRGNTLENIIVELISEDFINEERFARAYVRGKFRMKKWGTHKIISELKRRKISEYCIKKAMLEIEPKELTQSLQKLVAKKSALVSEKHPIKRNQKIAAYAIRKGYPSELVWKLLNAID